MSTIEMLVLSKYHYNPTMASTYGSSAYDTANYNGTNSTTTVSGGASGGSSGGLTNTGIAIASIVTLAAVIMLVAMVVRIWKRPSKKATESTDQ